MWLPAYCTLLSVVVTYLDLSLVVLTDQPRIVPPYVSEAVLAVQDSAKHDWPGRPGPRMLILPRWSDFNEPEIGQVLKKTKVPREEIFITTKL